MTSIFQHPYAFLLLLAIPLFFLLRKLGIFSKPAFPVTMADWKGQAFEWKRSMERAAAALSAGLFIAGYICLVVALANPIVVHQEKIYTSRGTDILFVIDTSPSMSAQDIAGTSRLEAAKQAVRRMVPEAAGCYFGLVAMGSDSALVVPPTTDHAVFFDRLDSLSAGTFGDGTAIGEGVSTAVYHLVASAAPKKCIVLVTDGENNAGKIHPETAAHLAKEHKITLYALGIGTRGSVPIEYVDPVTGAVYTGFLDSQFDSSSLEKIAMEADGKYFGVESSGALYSALQTITNREQTVQSFYLKTVEESFYDTMLGVTLVAFALAWLLRRIYMGEQV